MFPVRPLFLAAGAFAVTAAAAEPIDFARDVRPILSDTCFHCHGPDPETRKSDYRLDVKDGKVGAFSDRGGHVAIVAGKPDESDLIVRILSDDRDEVMPPPKFNRQLTAAQKETLRKWVEQGAKWGGHWAFEPVQRPTVPAEAARALDAATAQAWRQNPIDAFVLAKLQREGIAPSPEADPQRLLRRLSLDLTGLPPSPTEVDAFVAQWKDDRNAAVNNAVERLLASPHYGERMAMDWLDAARFADTNGYQTDETRDMSRWREWVIDAFNRNQPFDQFTIEQLAGDLLPKPTREQLIATGFNRNHRINTEGGSIAEEFLVETVIDRVETTSAVWLGLTMGCARCHDHKYDPISMREFYEFYAFFNTVEETGLGDRDEFSARGKRGNTRPLLSLATDEHRAKLADFDRQIAAATADVKRLENDELPTLEELAQRLDPASTRWTVIAPDVVHSAGGAVFTKLDDGSVLAAGPRVAKDAYEIELRTELQKITGLCLELLPDASLPQGGVGRGDNGNAVLSEIQVETEALVKPGGTAKRKIAFATAEFSQDKRDIAGAIDGRPDTAWSVLPEVARPQAAVLEFSEPISAEGGIRFIVKLRHEFPKGELAHAGRFRLALTTDREPFVVPRPVAAALKITAAKRNAAQNAAIEAFRRSRSPKLREATAKLTALEKDRAKFERALPTTMVMGEMAKPRASFILKRGLYDQPGDQVSPGVPAALPPLPPGAPANRLGLAQWLVDPANPLTARVTVNRLWQMFFGQGLVRSAENFGSQAEAPSHPELLDWLASEFVAGGWDVKRMVKLIATSATYRQATPVTRELLDRDPENRLLARGPRLRLSAETIRDQALAIGGLLTREIGGRSVRPYQPAGLWEEIAFDPKLAVYEQDHGPALYKRSLYTFWKRTVPPPTMTTFDAPSREICVVARQRTSTPLQALVLMNDPTFVEAARGLAQRMIRDGGATSEARLAHGFRLALARSPDAAELKVLAANYAKQRARFSADAAAAGRLLAVGESPRDPDLDAAELAATTAVASLLLNLDEAITKE